MYQSREQKLQGGHKTLIIQALKFRPAIGGFGRKLLFYQLKLVLVLYNQCAIMPLLVVEENANGHEEDID